MRDETFSSYNAHGQLLQSQDLSGIQATNSSSYDGLGQLRSNTFSSLPFIGATQPVTNVNRYTLDAMGNLTLSDGNDLGTVNSGTTLTYQYYNSVSARLDSTAYQSGPSGFLTQYDSSGNGEWSTYKIVQANMEQRDRRSYYGADNMLRAVDSRYWLQNSDLTYNNSFEEYWYDALGRRVFVRSRRNCSGTPLQNGSGGVDGECAVSFVRRTVWDGSQELGEIQAPGADGTTDSDSDTQASFQQVVGVAGNTTDANHFYGIAAYTFGTNLDQPLSIARKNYADGMSTSTFYVFQNAFDIIPLWNQRDQADGFRFNDGATQYSETPAGGTTRYALVDTPNGWFAWYRSHYPNVTAWNGSLLMDKQDKSGMLYRRNRYYDPTSGRFTQEDPIGLAGGLNLYGFASGDPVNFSDPFGLCVKDDTVCQGLVNELRAQKGSEFQRAADRYEAADYRVHMVSATDSRLDPYGLNSDRDPESWVIGRTNTSTKDVYLRSDLSTGDQLVNATHEARHIAGFKHPRDDTAIYHADWKAFNQLPPSIRRGAVFESDLFYSLWGSSYGKPFVSRP